MINQLEEKKVYYPETIDEEPLPETLVWESIANRPRTLEELDPDAKSALDAIGADFLTLGDLAYLDSITTTQITDNAITTPKLAAGAVVASKISVGSLSAISADLGTITAGSITGALIRTSDTGARIEISGSTDRIRIYDSGNEERMRLDQENLIFYDAAGNETGRIGALYSNILAVNIPTGELGFVVYYNAAEKFAVGLSGSVFYDDINMQNNNILACGDIEANDSTSDIGTSTIPFDNLYIEDIHFATQTSNPTSNGQMRYYNSGGSEGIRCQFGGSDFQFDASAV